MKIHERVGYRQCCTIWLKTARGNRRLKIFYLRPIRSAKAKRTVFMHLAGEQEKRMWDKYGGGLSGGVRIDSTIERLITSLPEEDFGIEHWCFGYRNAGYIHDWNSNRELAR